MCRETGFPAQSHVLTHDPGLAGVFLDTHQGSCAQTSAPSQIGWSWPAVRVPEGRISAQGRGPDEQPSERCSLWATARLLLLVATRLLAPPRRRTRTGSPASSASACVERASACRAVCYGSGGSGTTRALRQPGWRRQQQQQRHFCIKLAHKSKEEVSISGPRGALGTQGHHRGEAIHSDLHQHAQPHRQPHSSNQWQCLHQSLGGPERHALKHLGTPTSLQGIRGIPRSSPAQTRVVAHQAVVCAVDLKLGCAIPGAHLGFAPRVPTRPPGPRKPSHHKHWVPAAQTGPLRHSTLWRTRLLCRETPVPPHKLWFRGTIWCFATRTPDRIHTPQFLPATPRIDCLPV
jgi:hypothetical protein